MNWLRKYLLSMEHTFVVDHIAVPEEKDWHRQERALIAWGRQLYGWENVCNVSSGGEGEAKDYVAKKNISETTKAAMHRPEVMEKVVEGTKAAWARPGFREMMVTAQNDPATSRKRSKTLLETWSDDGRRKAHSERMKAAYSKEEARRGLSERARERQADPAVKKMLAENTRASWARLTPEQRRERHQKMVAGKKKKAER